MKSYFNQLEEMLAVRGKLSAFSGHNPDIGTNREDALIDILNKHLPDRLKAISGGTIVNLEGEESGQMDIIINSDIFPNFGGTSKPRVIAESVVGVISVKSKLNKNELVNAIENVASVPSFTDTTLSFDQGAIQRAGLEHKKLCIRYLRDGGVLNTGETLPERYMNPLLLTEETQGYSIAGIITTLNNYIGWMQYMNFNLSPYIDRAFEQSE